MLKNGNKASQPFPYSPFHPNMCTLTTPHDDILNPSSIRVKYSLILFGKGGGQNKTCLCFELLMVKCYVFFLF